VRLSSAVNNMSACWTSLRFFVMTEAPLFMMSSLVKLKPYTCSPVVDDHILP